MFPRSPQQRARVSTRFDILTSTNKDLYDSQNVSEYFRTGSLQNWRQRGLNIYLNPKVRFIDPWVRDELNMDSKVQSNVERNVSFSLEKCQFAFDPFIFVAKHWFILLVYVSW